MALSLKIFLFIAIISIVNVTNTVSTFLEPWECSDKYTSCDKCSFTITLTETAVGHNHVLVCCTGTGEQDWIQKLTNKTYVEVDIHLDLIMCNVSNIDFMVPKFDTFSIAIRNNNIANINLDVKNKNLQSIDMSSNTLKFITKGLFNKFSNLRKLILSQNSIIDIFDGSFDGLSKLESLDLSENKLTILTNVFTPLKNLQHLNLSRNNIEFIHENYFNNWLLQHLDVSHNNLKKVAPGALQLLPNLARLLLTDNPHLGITQLDTQLLVGTGRRLQQIDASRIGLYQVPEAFTHSVRFLSLVGNRISAVRCGDLDSYPLLQSLDFSNNKIMLIEDDSLGRLEMLLFLNLNKNLLTAIPRSLPDELKYFSLNNNLVKNLSIPDFKGLPNLRIVLLQNNNIKFIEDHVFDDLLSLEILDISNNPIQTLSSSSFDGPLSLRDLRLCYLNLSLPVQDGTFPISSPENVQMLHLQSSPGLAKLFLADSAALAAFSHLQYLDLRMNDLPEIRKDLLFYLSQLKTLRLHGNKINCNTELWLKDWMNWNNTLAAEETCYYSSTEAKTEVTKFNCTFPETFTISDSLPPVNLYSTEMINKLLRYYGYLNNKTERTNKRGNHRHKENGKQVFDNQINNIPNTIETTKDLTSSENLFNKSQDENLQLIQYSKHESYKSKSIFRKKDDSMEISKKGGLSKSLNTAINVSKKIFVNSSQINITKKNGISKMVGSKIGDRVLNESTSSQNLKTEYSPYQLNHHQYAQYIGMSAVFTLIIIAVIIWASFRFRQRRRVPVVSPQNDDQIEVSNISGRVLW